MIDGGSYRDCGCDHPQLVDNVGEIGGEPHPRVGIRRWVGSAGLIPFATRLDAAQTRMSLSQRISGVASHVHGPVGLARPTTKTTMEKHGGNRPWVYKDATPSSSMRPKMPVRVG